MHIIGYQQSDFIHLRKQAKEKIVVPSQKFIATDISPKAIEIARENAKIAQVDQYIDFSVNDFRETHVPKGKGVVFLNPEYGARLGEEKKLMDTYRGIGDFFKKKCAGYRGFIFTGSMNLAKNIGLKPKRKIEFLNARIDSRLISYELYSGTKKRPSK